MMKRTLIVTGICFLAACSKKNNLLMGRVEANVGNHTVVVTDCYRTRVPDPQRLSDEAGHSVWRYTPCRDADIWIRGEQLTVNGKEYGRLNPADAVLVDHGIVSIERRGERHGAADQAPQAAVQAVWSKTASTRPASFANRRIMRLRQSWSWRKASTRIKQCSRWCSRFVSALSRPQERPA